MTYNKLFFLYIIIIFFGGCEESKGSLLKKAEVLETQGNYEKAIVILDQLIKNNPNYIGAYINRGADKSALGHYEEAIKDYKRVLLIDSINSLAAFNIGNNYKRLGNYHKSLIYYDLSEKYSREIYSKNKAYQLIIKKDFQYELSQFEVSLESIRYERGFTHYSLKNYHSALSDFSNIPTNNRDHQAQYMIGASLLMIGKNIEGCVELRKATFMGNEIAKSTLEKNCR